MTEAELMELIFETFRNQMGSFIATYPGTRWHDIAQEITRKVMQAAGPGYGADSWRKSLPPAGPPAYTPNRACDCGGERAKSAHANWCQLQNPPRRFA